jgi:ketosteroid isomerase-like protein
MWTPHYLVCLMLGALPIPALAADADQILKQEIEKVHSEYAASFNRQDGATIAALFAHDGIIVNSAGPRTDVADIYPGVWKAGFDHMEETVNQVWPFGNDAALVLGQYHTTGKNQDGTPIELLGRWTAVDVREGGNWKIRMLSVMRQSQPAN